MWLLKYPDTLDLEVSRNHKDTVCSFGDKMRFFNGSWECWLKNIWFPLITFSSLWRYYETTLSVSLHQPLEATGFMTTTVRHSGNKGHESLGTKVSWFPSVTLRHFRRAENAIPLVSWDPRLKVMWLLVGHIGHLDTLKMPFCWVMRPWVQGDMPSNLNIYSIIKAWKFNYSSATRPSTNMYLAFHKASVQSFDGLKMKFFNDHETLGYTIVERSLQDCLTNVQRLIIDCLRIVHWLTNDFWTIVKRLVKDCWKIIKRLLHD